MDVGFRQKEFRYAVAERACSRSIFLASATETPCSSREKTSSKVSSLPSSYLTARASSIFHSFNSIFSTSEAYFSKKYTKIFLKFGNYLSKHAKSRCWIPRLAVKARHPFGKGEVFLYVLLFSLLLYLCFEKFLLRGCVIC